MIPDAKLLLHPNIPKPLHGLNPRTIMGDEWWDRQKRDAKLRSNYFCCACGVSMHRALYHRWLEAHENYEIDYQRGVMRIVGVVALCHACHAFIHNGRLFAATLKRLPDFSFEKAWRILHRGFSILRKSNLPPNSFALAVALALNTYCVQNGLAVPTWSNPAILIPEINKLRTTNDIEDIAWSDWRLEFDGKLYEPLFASFDAWSEYYGFDKS